MVGFAQKLWSEIFKGGLDQLYSWCIVPFDIKTQGKPTNQLGIPKSIMMMVSITLGKMASSQIFSLRLSPAPAPPPAQWLRIRCGFGFSCCLDCFGLCLCCCCSCCLTRCTDVWASWSKVRIFASATPRFTIAAPTAPQFGWFVNTSTRGNTIFQSTRNLIRFDHRWHDRRDGSNFPLKEIWDFIPIAWGLSLLGFFGGIHTWRVINRFWAHGLPTTSSTATTSPSTPALLTRRLWRLLRFNCNLNLTHGPWSILFPP